MFFSFLSNLSISNHSPDVDNYSRLISENFTFIEKQCRRAVMKNPNDVFDSLHNECALDNEADELLNEVLDHLKADDFKVLRDFKGKAKLTTYLTTIIASLVVNIFRRKKGRSRARERAEEFGTVGDKIYELVYVGGYSISEAQSYLQINHGISEPLESLQQMLDKIRGRSQHAHGGEEWPYKGKEIMTEEGVEVIVSDPSPNAEEFIMDAQRDEMAKRFLTEIIDGLSGEERFILTLRFPIVEGEEPKGNRKIADILSMTEKAVDNRIRRILSNCRGMLLKKGLSLDDLI